MRGQRSYYSENIHDFLRQSNDEIFGIISSNNTFDTTIQQSDAWMEEIKILKQQLDGFDEGRIIFEYVIPRMGKRVDTVILYKNIVFILEFKCGESVYSRYAYDQVYDYALDLRNFQKESSNKLIAAIQISTAAPDQDINIIENDRIIEPISCNKCNIREAIEQVCSKYDEPVFSYTEWEQSEYLPTPTIIEAARAMYEGHSVDEITRSDAGAKNLTATTEALIKIIEHSKEYHKKSICFVTGVPGAGKTLVGLNLAIQYSKPDTEECAAFLSGNSPLVSVLQEALARDHVERSQHQVKKTDALREARTFIQDIHKYRDAYVNNMDVPPEGVVIFDEAQRAWTKDMISDFMRRKKNVSNFDYSEPEFLISTMNRRDDWAVVVCLVGGGQEINTGEAGLPEWFDSLNRSFGDWDVYVTPELNDDEYRRGRSWSSMVSGLNINEISDLHLSTSVRSFRTPDLSAFIDAMLDVDITKAKELYDKISNKYPIVITRNLDTAKIWAKSHGRGTTRYGLLASSGALRLKPEGIYVKSKIDIADWLLNDKEDVRSSYALEDVATEFDIQGLELDYSIVAWDSSMRFCDGTWKYYNFRGNSWNNISEERQLYLKNAYRVLLTRARQGMVIFIPYGDDLDATRKTDFYDGTYTYLRSLGIQDLDQPD
ncbi:MAG: DUF2075 domain-containing protein [Candidatus Saccharibacteria bacterium]|nr:DUF2075 domain-containing protein [Candidatus Saccharibacteria bacterium]